MSGPQVDIVTGVQFLGRLTYIEGGKGSAMMAAELLEASSVIAHPHAGSQTMLFRLIVTTGLDMRRVFEIESGELLLVGRGHGCAIQLNDARVSKVHCRIHAQGGNLRIVDAGSLWGTVVNGRKVAEQQLQPGDVITLGETELRVEVASEAAATTVAPPEEVHPRADVRAEVPPDVREIEDSGKANFPERARPDSLNLNDLVGTRLLRYEIGEIVARARTGIVFRAWDTRKERPVALKILWPELTQQKDEVRRFLRAIKTMIAIKHENLVALYGAGKTGTYCFTASEFVEGESVAKIILRVGIGGMLEWQRAFRVTWDIAHALEVAHSHQIVHRNITPQNILIRDSDQVAKLGDLMLAKALEGTHAETITQPGQLVGDLAYMSPEQTGETQPIDCRSDMYNLGATIYALVTGRPPFDSPSVSEMMTRIQHEKPRAPREFHLSLPSRFEAVVLRLLAKRPEDRYQTPIELLRELKQVAKYEGYADWE